MTQATRQKFTILLLEDDPADAHLVREAFVENHFFVDLHHVTDGVQGLAFLRHVSPFHDTPRPDLILLDLNMPRMDGREFLSRIKQDDALCMIPVIILTTSDVERDVMASFKLGAAGYIVKPVDIEQFIASIRQLEDYWFTLVRLPDSP